MKLPKNIAFLVLALSLTQALQAAGEPPVELSKGMIISSSAKIKKGIYSLNGHDSLNRPVIMIKGNNITVDFDNALLQGSTDKQLPNQFYGLAILIKGNNITLKNARVSGYKVAVMAEGCKNLKIEHSDFSYNYRQQLHSSWLHEDVSDWMSFHHNEHDEWLRYGAGIYLKDCSKSVIQNNTITGGQCALMMMRCNDGEITDNDFSFNSAIGIGMYRSSGNFILHNKLDFNVRGHSEGFYNRGQDSAGILVFEQCNENIFAYNSVTHSGDGFFLWAGQTTMDTGEGGCNENLIEQNDFSYAPTNGVEVTFSRNGIYNNIIKECDNGIWGGYSFKTEIYRNKIIGNKVGIAIEHGQENDIFGNLFDSNSTGVKLWARKKQPSDWGYAQKRDTRSRNYHISENEFFNNAVGLDVSLTDTIDCLSNKRKNNKLFYKISEDVTNIDTSNLNFTIISTDTTALSLKEYSEQNKLPSGKKVSKIIPKLGFHGTRKNIRITEWGPYDFRYPIIFLNKIDSNDVYHFEVLGPKGKYEIKNSSGFEEISYNENALPGKLTAHRIAEDVQIQMEYVGEAFTGQFGKIQAANKPYLFSFRDFQPEINWNVNWYKWDAAHDPNKNYEQFKTIFANKPVKTEQVKKIDYTWWGAIDKNLPADSFAVVATGNVDVAPGMYRLSVTADDIVKIFVDEKPVIDFWDVSKYKYDEDTYHEAFIKLNGKHRIRIEHAENAGYATLIFKLTPVKN